MPPKKIKQAHIETKNSVENVFDFLPIELFRHILQYLALNDFGRLDASLLNHQTRSRYHSVTDGIDISGLLDVYINYKHEEWFLSRNFEPKELKLEHSSFSKKLLNKFRNSLCHLVLWNTDVKAPDCKKLGCFPKLVSLSLPASYCLSTEGLENWLIVNPQLEKIDISNNYQLTDSIPMILSHCSHLTHLKVGNGWFNDECLDLLTESGLQIKSINLFRAETTRPAILRFLDKMKGSLRGIILDRVDLKMELLGLESVARPSLFHHDPEVQLLGLESFSFACGPLGSRRETETELFSAICSWTDVIHRFIEFLSVPVRIPSPSQ
jgi:hypothetical protein